MASKVITVERIPRLADGAWARLLRLGFENVTVVETIGDLGRVGEMLSGRGYSDEAVAAIMHGNWLRFLRDLLPA